MEDDEWDSEDEYAGGLEAGDGAHLEGAWRQQDGAFLEGGLADEGGGGDVGMKLRKRIGIDEDTTWDDVLRENGINASRFRCMTIDFCGRTNCIALK